MALYNSLDEIRFLLLAVCSPLLLYHCFSKKARRTSKRGSRDTLQRETGARKLRKGKTKG
jgi:phage-related protein